VLKYLLYFILIDAVVAVSVFGDYAPVHFEVIALGKVRMGRRWHLYGFAHDFLHFYSL
jgi:hypothetical protein